LEARKRHLVANVLSNDKGVFEKPECLSRASERELEVTFLGTGSAIPSKYRNLSGIYCHMFERGGILLDSGEGACSQLVRRYGPKFDEILSNLRVVWISHIHADHHSGLPSLLRMRSRLTREPLVIVGPRQLRRVLSMYSKIEHVPMEFIDCNQTRDIVRAGEGGLEIRGAESQLPARLEALGIASLQSVEVHHSCYNCYGCVLVGKQGWKLAYSGDTRPCKAFVEAAANATIFIHEATFENELRAEAEAKKHSLTAEAVASGIGAKAYRTILTHFSQRYPKIPVIDETFTPSTCIAFDLMTFNLRNLEHLPTVVPDVAVRFEGRQDAAAAAAAE